MKTKPEPALDIDSAELVVLELNQNKEKFQQKYTYRPLYKNIMKDI